MRRSRPMSELKHGSTSTYGNYKCRCAECTAAHREACRKWRRERLNRRVLVDGDLVHPDADHGTYNAYTNYGCQCALCRTARAEYVKERPSKPRTAKQREAERRRKAARKQQRVLVDGALVHPDADHGTYHAYTAFGCRCAPCRAASAASQRKRRARA